MERDFSHALAFAERITGGKIVGWRQQERWRPHLFVTLEQPTGAQIELLLRGPRAPGWMDDEAGVKERLRKEAGVYEALQETPVKISRYYGYEEVEGWLAIEAQTGEYEITKITDAQRRHAILCDYWENIAEVNKLDISKLSLPNNIDHYRTQDELAYGEYRRWKAFGFDKMTIRRPEPLMHLCAWWIENHPPTNCVGRLCPGDVGADQFFFEGARMKCTFDWEMAQIRDPLADIGLMRTRVMLYPVGRIADQIRHWANALGEQLDRHKLNFFSLVGFVESTLGFMPNVQFPKACNDAAVFGFAFDSVYRRGAAEMLAEIYDIDLDWPECPPDEESFGTKFNDLVVDHFENVYLPDSMSTEHTIKLRNGLAVAKIAERYGRIGPELLRQDMADMASVLGYRPPSRVAGLARLEELVKADPERDLDARLRCFHRMQVREEYVVEPLQHLMATASRVRHERMTW